MSLVPCPSCHRHVRVAEASCPFCRAALPAALASRAVPAPTQRLSRAAAFVFTTTLGLAGCGDTVTNLPPQPVDAAGDQGSDGAVTDTGAPDGATPDRPASQDVAPPDDGGNVALYGAPVDRDASAPDAAPDRPAPQDAAADRPAPPDDGGNVALYGAPVDRDAAPAPEDASLVRDGGGVMPLYGGPVRIDAGVDDVTPVRDGGGIVPLYGAVPAPDAGRDAAADVSIGVRYGGPPRPDGGF